MTERIGDMRIGIVTESFLPNVNGVTNSVLRVLDYLAGHGHEAVVVAPGSREYHDEVFHYRGFAIRRVPTVHVPLVNSLPVGVPTIGVVTTLRDFAPDVIHLASPFVLGAGGAWAAAQLGVPAVAVYQTDVAGFSSRYHLAALANAAWEWTRIIHNSAARTLAPSSVAEAELREHGVNNVHRWARGVDCEQFSPRHRSADLRRAWDPTGTKRIVGYVGRLAAEKGVHRLRCLVGREDVQLVIVGDGPQRAELERALPGAVFTGQLGGTELAQAYASLDLFVHTGEFETFCQTVQEAQASGVPTIAPRAGGPIDLISPPRTGALLEVATFERDLPGAVAKMLAPGIHERACRACREEVAARTWDAQCERLMQHYLAAIEQFTPRHQWRARMLAGGGARVNQPLGG